MSSDVFLTSIALASWNSTAAFIPLLTIGSIVIIAITTAGAASSFLAPPPPPSRLSSWETTTTTTTTCIHLFDSTTTPTPFSELRRPQSYVASLASLSSPHEMRYSGLLYRSSERRQWLLQRQRQPQRPHRRPIGLLSAPTSESIDYIGDDSDIETSMSATAAATTASATETKQTTLGTTWKRKRTLTEEEKEKWKQRLDEMKQYQDENNGSSYPPKGTPLGYWAKRQRTRFNKNQMYSDRIELLDSINFQWSKASDRPRLDWDVMFGRLVEYKERFGDTNVPTHYPEDTKLRDWCWRQKKRYSKGKLDPDKMAKLDAIGFVFDEVVPQDERWDTKYNRLVEYRKKNNSTLVPNYYEEDPELGNWVNDQRRSYNSNDSSMTPERIERLEAIGFVWDPLEAAWLEMYSRLEEYKQINGDADVPKRYKKDPKLGTWVSTQRKFYRKGKISTDRIEMLEAVGFRWSLVQDERWDTKYNRLVEYRKKNNSTLVPNYYEEDSELGLWVKDQRRFYKISDSRMTVERVERLGAIGFVWDAQEASWLEMYSRLVEYWEENGHSDFSTKSKEDPKLGKWVSHQRTAYRKGKMSTDRIEKLEAIGFQWSLVLSQAEKTQLKKEKLW